MTFGAGLFLVPCAVTLLISWMTPRAWTGVLLIVVVCAAVAAYSLDWRGDGPAAALGIAILMIAGMGLVAGLGLGLTAREVLHLLQHRRLETRAKSDLPARISFLLLGAALVIVSVLAFSGPPSSEPVWVVHAKLLMAAAGALAVAGSFSWLAQRRRTTSWPIFYVFYGFGIAGVGIEVWSGVGIDKVLSAARLTADGAPYCLQVASGDDPRRKEAGEDHRAAIGWLDLSPLTMRGNRGSSSVYHAILVVDAQEARRLYNWSYRNGSFQPISAEDEPEAALRRHAVYCRPTLTGFAPVAEDDALGFQLAGRTVSIPRAFRPKIKDVSGPGFFFAANGPSFDPPAGNAKDDPAGHLSLTVWVNLDPRRDDRRWSDAESSPSYTRTLLRDRAGMIFGVTECRNPDFMTMIGPQLSEASPCRWELLHRGMMITFDHPRADPDRAASLRDALTKRIDGFVTDRDPPG